MADRSALLCVAGGVVAGAGLCSIVNWLRQSQVSSGEITLAVGLVGPGAIGTTFLKQVAANRDANKRDLGVDVRVVGICNSKVMVLGENPSVDAVKRGDGSPADLSAFGKKIRSQYANAVIIDTSASDVVGDHYEEWIKMGLHVITANKKFHSGDLKAYESLNKSLSRTSGRIYYEGTAGAGLPVTHMLKEFIRTGDKVLSVEGIMSGTISYIFNNFAPASSGDHPAFSDLVLQAKEKGFTEPDPRDDLSGTDVARKVVILAREIGIPATLEKTKVESLVPKALQSVSSADEYLKRMPEFDNEMGELRSKAASEQCVVRFVGSVSADGTASVGLKRYPFSHPFAGLSGTDNIFLIRTERYNENPLVVIGPGAGGEVTAGGVYGDMYRLMMSLGSCR